MSHSSALLVQLLVGQRFSGFDSVSTPSLSLHRHMTTCAPEDGHLPGSPFYDSVSRLHLLPIPRTCECVHACVCICGNFHRGQRLKSGTFLCPFCESGSLTKPGNHQFRSLAGQRAPGSSSPCLPSTGVTDVSYCLTFCVDAGI